MHQGGPGTAFEALTEAPHCQQRTAIPDFPIHAPFLHAPGVGAYGTIDTMFTRIVEDVIHEAIERGDFDDLPGAGKPVDLSAYFETPEELRLAHSVLRNANLLPEEVELRKQISAQEDAARLAADETQLTLATRRLRQLRLKFDVLMDGLRRQRVFK